MRKRSTDFKAVEKHCRVCGKQLVLRNSRDIQRKQYCDKTCKAIANRHLSLKHGQTCAHCGKLFDATGTAQRFCSTACTTKFHTKSTEHQYDRISGNWGAYLNRLCAQKGRGLINKQILLELLERQKFRCAVSGVELTCKLENGTICPTNASIDRIIPGKEYEVGNIQLVCRQVNTMKWTLPIGDLVWWCREIINNQGEDHAV